MSIENDPEVANFVRVMGRMPEGMRELVRWQHAQLRTAFEYVKGRPPREFDELRQWFCAGGPDVPDGIPLNDPYIPIEDLF